MKKLLSVVLALVFVLSAFALTSCELMQSAAKMLESADAALKNAPYTVKVSTDFECDDATINTVFDAMSLEVPVTVDGENIALELSMEVMGQKLGTKMTVVDKVLYSDIDLGITQMKMKATLDDTQLKEFVAENSAELPVDYLQFEELKLESKDGKQVITCSGITTEGMTALNDQVTEALKSMGAEGAVGDISYIVTLADGKYESMALSVSYSLTMEGKTYNLSMTMNAKYEYENVAKVAAPADADSYQSVSYADIIG